MPTVLITGANRGLGLEFVKQYAKDGWNVIACSRNPDKAQELMGIAQKNKTVRTVSLDIGDNKSILRLADKLQDTPIDLLINNAGIFSGASSSASATTGDPSQDFGSIDAAAWEKVLRINTIAPIMMAETFVPNLKKGTGKKIVNITSRMGSFAFMAEGSIAYRTSKTALNAAMRTITQDLQKFGITIINMHPGWVQTDMGSKSADLVPEESIRSMKQVINNLNIENAGQVLTYNGQILPW